MNKHSLPPLNNKRSKSTVFIPLIIIIISFHLILLYIYVNRKSDKEHGSDTNVAVNKAKSEHHSDTPIQNQLLIKTDENEIDETVELELAEEDSNNQTDNPDLIVEDLDDGSLPALISKNDNQIEGNPKYQTLFTPQDTSVVNNNQNTAPMPLETAPNPADNQQTTAKKHRHSHRPRPQPRFEEPPYVDEPMYPPVYQEPEPQVTEQDIKDSALLTVDLPESQRPQLVPINKKAKETLQKMEQAKKENDKIQEQLSKSIQNVRALNARKIEQEKQLARRAYEDSLALKQLKNQTRKEKTQKTEPKKVTKAEPKKTPTVASKKAPKATTATKQAQKVAPKKSVAVKTVTKNTPKAKIKKSPKVEPKKAVQPQKKAQPKPTATPKVKATKPKAQATKKVEPKPQDKKAQP